MGDRCFMEVHCERKARKAFEKLGFTLQNEETEKVLFMIDEEANYAHSDEMPRKFLYYGEAGSGYSYGPSQFACDGKKFDEFNVSFSGDSYCVSFDENTGEPFLDDIKEITEFILFRSRVIKTLEEKLEE